MGQMPRGEPRTVPNPVGDLYDAMVRQERLKRQRTEAPATPATPSATDYFSPFNDHRLDFLHQATRRDPAVTVSGREIDARCVVLRPGSPAVSPAELAERRRTIERAFFMADHPLAGAAYGLAALINASPATRERALMAGGLADTAMLGAAPYGAPIRGRAPPPRGQVAPPTLARPNIRYRELSPDGRATGVSGTITAPLPTSGTRARRNPPGWQGDGDVFNEARGHLLGRQFGGSGRDMRNVVTLSQNRTNNPEMSNFENAVARRARAGEVIEYSSTPLYRDGALPPSAVLLTATGSRGLPAARIINNPAGNRR